MDNAVMNEAPPITIDDFCHHFMCEYGNYDPHKDAYDFDYATAGVNNLSREFIKYFELQHPFSIEALLTICKGKIISSSCGGKRNADVTWTSNNNQSSYEGLTPKIMK